MAWYGIHGMAWHTWHGMAWHGRPAPNSLAVVRAGRGDRANRWT
jgi:hypothetical protein